MTKYLPINKLRELLSYDASTGILSWNISISRSTFGSKAGRICRDGYVYIRFDGLVMLGHRIAWALHTGAWPTVPLDHKNMIKSDNRIVNLRLASVAENNRNRSRQSNNTTGFKGVSFNKSSGKYQAKITHNKNTICLGCFIDIHEAAAAYKSAAKELHGEFARF